MVGLVRFIRVERVIEWLQGIETNFHYNYVVVSLFKFVSLLLLAAHFSG